MGAAATSESMSPISRLPLQGGMHQVCSMTGAASAPRSPHSLKMEDDAKSAQIALQGACTAYLTAKTTH